mgnify:CR=1 FL=1
MGEWHKTGCVLCAQNCGLEVLVENNRMTKVKPDKSNPRSQGYACRKGLRVIYHQYPEGRLTEPLKRVRDQFKKVFWDKAIDEIAAKMRQLVDTHGPRCLAYMGGGSQGGHMEVAFGLGILRSMGSQYYYSSAGQEFCGAWWVTGRVFGKQYNFAGPDEHETEMLVAWGWNGMQSHQMPRAPKVLMEISKDPDRILVAVDPRKFFGDVTTLREKADLPQHPVVIEIDRQAGILDNARCRFLITVHESHLEFAVDQADFRSEVWWVRALIGGIGVRQRLHGDEGRVADRR